MKRGERMAKEIVSFAATVLAGTAVFTLAVYITDHWLARANNPRLRRPLRVRKIRKPRPEPDVRKRIVVYPSDKEVREK